MLAEQEPLHGIYMELIDLDAMFESLTFTPIIVNDINVDKMEEKERLNKLLYTHYEGDTLDIIPTCDCGEIKGEYNVGLICDTCGTKVANITERPLEPLLWITAPEGVDRLITPDAWIILSNHMTVRNCNLLEYLTNPHYRPLTKIAELEKIPDHWERSLNFFYRNFDEIMAFTTTVLLASKPMSVRFDLIEFIKEFKDLFFCRYIPFPSKLGFVTESNPIGRYADASIKLAIESIRTICSINTSITPVSQIVRESRAAKAISQLAAFHRAFKKDRLGIKEGIYRKHIYGSRTDFTGRAVISPIVGEHKYDSIHLPWGVAVQIFRIHLTNKLLKRGYNPNQINGFFHEYVSVYSPLLGELFDELIAESPWRGIPVLFGRNPTLARGSIALFFVDKIKIDITDKTISISVGIVKQPNADFDGDEMNLSLLNDNQMVNAFMRMSHHLTVLDLRRPKQIAGDIWIPGPLLSTLNNFLFHEK